MTALEWLLLLLVITVSWAGAAISRALGRIEERLARLSFNPRCLRTWLMRGSIATMTTSTPRCSMTIRTGGRDAVALPPSLALFYAGKAAARGRGEFVKQRVQARAHRELRRREVLERLRPPLCVLRHWPLAQSNFEILDSLGSSFEKLSDPQVALGLIILPQHAGLESHRDG